MSTLQEIERAILNLPAEEFQQLAKWIEAERNRKWDHQIEQDSDSGALDFLLREVEDDIARGRTRPTDELCDNS